MGLRPSVNFMVNEPAARVREAYPGGHVPAAAGRETQYGPATLFRLD